MSRRLLDRVRVAGGNIRVITPRPRTTRGSPFGSGVEWLALEERFTFYGGGISFIGLRHRLQRQQWPIRPHL
jgi:hypothetical protein